MRKFVNPGFRPRNDKKSLHGLIPLLHFTPLLMYRTLLYILKHLRK